MFGDAFFDFFQAEMIFVENFLCLDDEGKLVPIYNMWMKDPDRRECM